MGKVEQSREWSNTLPLTSVKVAIEKGALGLSSTKFIYIYLYIYVSK